MHICRAASIEPKMLGRSGQVLCPVALVVQFSLLLPVMHASPSQKGRPITQDPSQNERGLVLSCSAVPNIHDHLQLFLAGRSLCPA